MSMASRSEREGKKIPRGEKFGLKDKKNNCLLMVQAITISNNNITLYKITALFKLDNLKLCIHITYVCMVYTNFLHCNQKEANTE